MDLTDDQKHLIDLLYDMKFEPDIILELISKIKDKENLGNLLSEIEIFKDKTDEQSRSKVTLILEKYSS